MGWLGQVVTRLDRAIITMKKKEMVVFMAPPDLGYGATGINGVPSNCVFQFEVDLISWITVVHVCKNDGIIKKVMEKKEQIGPLPSQFLPRVCFLISIFFLKIVLMLIE